MNAISVGPDTRRSFPAIFSSMWSICVSSHESRWISESTSICGIEFPFRCWFLNHTSKIASKSSFILLTIGLLLDKKYFTVINLS